MTTRFRDPVLARTEAMRHVREHVARIEVVAGTGCRCRAESCAWHPTAAVECAGRPVLVLLPDAVGRLWVIAEVCSACAMRLPRGKVLKESAPPVPRERPTPANCTVCAQHELTAGPATEQVSVDGERTYGPPAAKWKPTAAYADHTEFCLRFLQDARVGRTPEARLIALLALLRMRKDGRVLLISEDLSSSRTGVNHMALQELIDDGWVEGSVEAVRAAVPGAPAAQCTMSRLAEPWLTGEISRKVRRPFNGWVQRLISHGLLDSQPAGVRLAALYITAMSNPQGHGQIGRRILANRCRFTSVEVSVPVLLTLLEIGWFSQLHPRHDPHALSSWRLSPEIRPIIPGAAGKVDTTPAPIALAGRGPDLAKWAHAYYKQHHHAPPLRRLVNAHCEENPHAPWTNAQMVQGIRTERDDGWLIIGTEDWRPVQPGPAYSRLLTESRTPKSTFRPRQQPHPAPPKPPPPPPGTSPHGHGPDLPLRPTRVTVPSGPPEPDGNATLRRLLLIPGARDVLQAHNPPAGAAGAGT
ncbi:hypothetical protein ABZ135_37590 [Streptomyces sp. NPDC006339]|uniref:hypothetical protein n=1 Tax=Streptomyces sp. NPDC006339 TaxID=3156755 RepID=UPI0033AA9523